MSRPSHPYTFALREAALPFAASTAEPHQRLPELAGRMTAAGGLGCAFAPRCQLAIARCRSEAPPLSAMGAARVACWRAGEIGP
jgi:oligopeptide/dipeptide ABC transporter ATP-binding protein